MGNTYSQIHLQVVFAVEARQCLIRAPFREEVQKYITGLVSQRGQKLLAIYCMPDHTHLLVGLRPSLALSDLVQDVKRSSSNFINGKHWIAGRFCWQEGFGAFSYGHSQVAGVIRYIREQEAHHARTSFRQEYVRFLKRFEVEYHERFIFRDVLRDG